MALLSVRHIPMRISLDLNRRAGVGVIDAKRKQISHVVQREAELLRPLDELNPHARLRPVLPVARSGLGSRSREDGCADPENDSSVPGVPRGYQYPAGISTLHLLC